MVNPWAAATGGDWRDSEAVCPLFANLCQGGIMQAERGVERSAEEGGGSCGGWGRRNSDGAIVKTEAEWGLGGLVQEKTCSPELCVRVRVELVDLANSAAMDKAVRSLTAPPAPPPPLSPAHSLPLPAITPLSPPKPLLFLFSLPFSSWSEHIGWATGISLPNRWALLVLAKAQAMVRERTRRGRETANDKQKEKERELERKGGKKKQHSALPAVVCARPTLIRLSIFFPILCSALPGPPSVCVFECVRVYVCECLAQGPWIRRHLNHLHFAKDFFLQGSNFFAKLKGIFIFSEFYPLCCWGFFFPNRVQNW